MADWNADLFVKLYSKMAVALGVTQTPGATDSELEELLGGPVPPRAGPLPAAPGDDSQFLLAIYNPGQYLPVSLDPVGNVDDRYALSVLFNVAPQFSWVFRPAATTITNAYDSVLQYKEAPLTSLTPEQKKKVDDANGVIGQWFDTYTDYQLKYWDALDAYDTAKASFLNGGAPVPPSLKRKVQAALDAWIARGHKGAVDAAIGVLAELEALDPLNFWNKLRQRYDGATESNRMGSDFQPVGVSPPYKSWFQDAGWTQFSFSQKDMDNQRNSEAIGVSGNLDLTFGIFKVSGSGDYTQDSKFVKIDQTELDFSCKLMRVSFDRNWMNPLVFSSTAWRWAKGTPAYGSHLSTGGDIGGSIAPTGDMTALPTAAILSKDLHIKGTMNKTVVEEFNREIRADASVGIGPFAISGRFNMGEHRGSEKGTIATDGIEAKDVQIIALVCQLLPRCPNPDNTLPWPG
jgi:hypothetical protein